jgi:hypothetical protein
MGKCLASQARQLPRPLPAPLDPAAQLKLLSPPTRERLPSADSWCGGSTDTHGAASPVLFLPGIDRDFTACSPQGKAAGWAAEVGQRASWPGPCWGVVLPGCGASFGAAAGRCIVAVVAGKAVQ